MTVAQKIPKLFDSYSKSLRGFLLATAFLFLLFGCTNPAPNQPGTNYTMKTVELDSLWILGSSQFSRMVVQAHPPEWAQGRMMICLITGGDTTNRFNLYDDGSEESHSDGQGFCENFSGDIAAGDGKFTRRLNSLFAANPGNYNLKIAFSDHPPGIDTLLGVVTVVRNSPPIVEWVTAPDSIPSGAQPPTFRVRVYDPDGQSDISSVQIGRSHVPRGSAPLDFNTMTRVNDSLFELVFPPAIGAGYPTGDHRFFCRAADFAMLSRDVFANSDTVAVWLQNGIPQIDSISSPDTVWVTASQVDSFEINIRYHDDQTPFDLGSMELVVTRYDSTLGRDTVTFRYSYYDDGTIGNLRFDTTAHDGVINTKFVAVYNRYTGMPYTFTWTPIDRSPQSGTARANVVVTALFGNGSPDRISDTGADYRQIVGPFK